MAFNRAVLDTEELTAHLGKEQLDLFDTRCIAALYRDTDNAKRARTESEQVIAAASSTHLAIAVDHTFNVFTTSGELGYICTFDVPEDQSIIKMKWLPNSDLLLLATNKANFRVFSVTMQKVVFLIDLPAEWESCEMEEFYNKRRDALAIFVIADTGFVYRIVLEAWQTSFCRSMKAENASEQLQALFADCFKKLNSVDMGDKRFEKITALSFTTVTGCCVDGWFRQVQQLLQGAPMRINMERKAVLPSCLRAHLVGNGTILAALTKEGTIEFVDLLTMAKIDSLLIPRSSTESITDFAFLEWPGGDASAYERIAIVIEKSGKTEVQIRQMDSLGVVAYSHKVVAGSFLIQLAGPSAESERLAMVIEPVDDTLGFSDQTVCVREVVETQPEQRLNRLISRNQLDEAERFALENKLNVQLVHAARVAHLLQQLNDNPDDGSIYEGFLKAVDKIDGDMGDWVLAAVPPLRNAEWISRLLEYAETKSISEDSAATLNDIAYNFATYRMVFGPNATYAQVWAEYQQSADWVKHWLSLLTIGNVAAARIIWHRYPVEFLSRVDDGVLFDAFQATKEMLKEFPTQWQFAIDHLECDVMSLGLSSVNCENTEQLYAHFIDLLVHIATMLEKYQQEDFPDNALYAVSAVERLINRLKKNALTGMKSAEFLSSASLSVPAIEAMYKRSRDLRAIKRLKETYECPLSYAKYKALSTKEICHEILQRSVQNPAQLRDRIDRIARPFMEEHSLPADETLLGHIEKVTSIARCQTSSEPLDVHCLLVKEAIASAAVRARAVLNIACNAPIPWSSKLDAAVQQVLSDDHIDVKIKKELNLTQDRMKLGSICQDYGLTRDYVDSIVDHYADFVGFIRYLISGEMTSAKAITDDGRYDIAAEAVSIYDRLRPGARPVETLGAAMREYVGMLIGRNDLPSLHKFVEKHAVIDDVIDLLVMREETEDYGFDGDKDWMTGRSASLVAINSLIQRYRRDDARWKDVYEEMRKMLKLVTKYNMDVSLIVLREPNMRAHLLHKFIKRQAKDETTDARRKLRECIDLTEVLGMTRDEAYLALLDYSIPMCPQKINSRSDEIDIDSGLVLARTAMLEAKSASVQLLQHVVHVAEQVVRRMIPLTPTSVMTLEECEKAFADAFTLSEILPAVLRLDVEMRVSARVFPMNRAVRLILEAVQQMQQSGDSSSQAGSAIHSKRNSLADSDDGMDEEKDASEVFEEKKKTAAPTSKKEMDAAFKREATLIGLSNRRRIGVYESSMDNPIMDVVDTMRVVCGVAFMMHERPDPNKSADAARLVETMEERWAELFSDLNLANQHLLEMHARVLYAVWGGRVEEHVLLPLTGAFAERLVSAHPCDLPLLATIFATLDDKSNMEALRKLIMFARRQKKAPQTALNICRLAQLLLARKERLPEAVRKDSAALAAQTPAGWTERAEVVVKGMSDLRSMFSRAMWEKTLGKKGVVAHTDAHRAVVEFASHLVQPETVREYLSESSLSKMPPGWSQTTRVSREPKVQLVCGGMRTYLAALLSNAGKAADAFEREGILVTADLTIELELSQSSYDREALRAALAETLWQFLEDDCCPYEHEVIQFVLSKIASLAEPDDERWKAGKKVADFVCLMSRECGISEAERVWYTERRAQRNIDASLMEDNMMRDETQYSQMPAKSSSRLPYHLFLGSSEVEISKFVVPIVWHEITLVSLQDWYRLLKDVQSLGSVDANSEKMKLKRTVLITKAVMKYIRAAQEQDDQLSDSDMEWIQGRLYEEKQVLPLMHSFFLEIKQSVPVGPTRIQLTQLGYNVTKKFLAEHTEDTQNRRKIDEHRLRTLESLREMSTKQLLQKHRVYNQETSPHIRNVDALISRIYDCFINWDEPTDVEKKCALIKELVEVNEHDIESTHEAIVKAWLCGERGSGEGEEELPDVDMNDTMGSSTGVFGGGASDGSGMKEDDDDHLPIPFYDEEVTRIVHVVRLSKRKKDLVVNTILNHVNMPTPPGGDSTHIRAVCTLLRALSADELEAWAPAGIDDYAANVDTRLNKRLVERSLGASAYPQFQKATEKSEKLQLFIRNLLMGTHRTRPGTVHLATVLTMDFYEENVAVDQKIIDHMLSKLNSERKYSLLAVFLKFCSSHKEFRQTRNLNVLWGRTIESAMRELEEDSAPVSSIHEWLLFALSCPTPGNRALESLKRLMEQRGANVGGYLIKLASSYTKNCSCAPSDSRRSPNIDYPLQWAATKDVEMEEN
ncbi:hypothetical protein PFISCL1PPCAC_7482 [Pristionchus fissidentatus]|uniref:RZZ complex subunit KNTC1/ROD C-terminal domain-containing protein n=1 Tax=Pristionchus fissidentatus TaxID=1538716 RepID=A0AAV5VE50_9BILA|nr:hypothetical protein PFISCL1PPCAC_7482 [Pristionchus fissidentatus]